MKHLKILSTIILFLSTYFNIIAQTTIQETADVFFPEKVVIALNHPYFNYAVNDAYLKGMKYETTFGEDSFNGKYRTSVPHVSLMTNPMENKDAYEFEMRSAKLMGIDAFKFEFRPLGSDFYIRQFKKIFAAYVKVAEEKEIDFKFTIAVEMNRNKNIPVTHMMMKVEKNLNELFETTNFSKKWLRTGNGKVIVFTKFTQKVIDEGLVKLYSKQFVKDPSLMEKVADVYSSLRNKLKDDVAFVYQADVVGNNYFVNQVLDHFPAVYTARGIQTYEKGIDNLKRICKNRKRPFVQSVFSDGQGVQLYSKVNNKKVEEGSKYAQTVQNRDLYIKGNNYKMTGTLRKLLEKGVNRDADAFCVSSWNFYDAGSHFAPEIHHGYGPGLLLNYYKNQWKNGVTTTQDEMVMVSFKNYMTGGLNKNTGITVKVNSRFYKLPEMDSVEIVTVLNEQGEVYCNNEFVGTAPKGVYAFYVPKEKGDIHVRVKRGKESVINYLVPKNIQAAEENIDFLTYTFSNLDRKFASFSQEIILNNEIEQMRKRFLISRQDQIDWKMAATERFITNLEAIQKYGHDSEKYLSIQDKNYKKYKLQIKSILEDLHYEIWCELEESAQNNKGMLTLDDDVDDVLKGYNILPGTQNLK
ncbi:hypothetical protein [Flammeovirga agarivorans]|uniref:Uncharacterized protein n=1 Tax=Flammeovirga agarivorans TaxID=2726742 RepID=A0A7X8XXN3_9BACT|nr:hypothetical protein [Flammeovirga agarivorans]NLR93407.1 hypothetical protein [Flammeovirga agarivorans]